MCSCTDRAVCSVGAAQIRNPITAGKPQFDWWQLHLPHQPPCGNPKWLPVSTETTDVHRNEWKLSVFHERLCAGAPRAPGWTQNQIQFFPECHRSVRDTSLRSSAALGFLQKEPLPSSGCILGFCVFTFLSPQWSPSGIRKMGMTSYFGFLSQRQRGEEERRAKERNWGDEERRNKWEETRRWGTRSSSLLESKQAQMNTWSDGWTD